MGIISFFRNLFGGKKEENKLVTSKETPKQVKPVKVKAEPKVEAKVETKVEEKVTAKEIKSKANTSKTEETAPVKPKRKYNRRKPAKKTESTGETKPKTTRRRRAPKKKED